MLSLNPRKQNPIFWLLWWTNTPIMSINPRTSTSQNRCTRHFYVFLWSKNRCTWGYVQTKIDAPRAISKPKSMYQTESGALIFWTLEIFWRQVHWFWFADTPRWIDLLITKIQRNAWYIDFGSLQSLGVLICIWGIVSVAWDWSWRWRPTCLRWTWR